MPASTQTGKPDTKDLLLEEYRAATGSLEKNEQTGETRVNWLIGVVTAAVGGLVGLYTAERPPGSVPLFAIVAVSLSSLLVFGIITLFRIMKRNAVTDGLKEDIADIRQIIKDHFDEERLLLYYRPFGPQDGPTAAGWPTRDKGGGRKLGGLAHIVAAINSLLAAGLVGATVFFVLSIAPAGIESIWLLVCGAVLAAIAFALAFRHQFAWIKAYEDGEKARLRKGRPTHAGGVVYRELRDGAVEWLIVGPKHPQASKPEERLFPKGHIDKAEGHAEAALREVREETGVVARLVCLVDRVAYKARGEEVDAKFYLMECLYEAEPEPDEKRPVEWLSAKAALAKLPHKETQYLLREAEGRLAGLR